jgi:hypothetical protein
MCKGDLDGENRMVDTPNPFLHRESSYRYPTFFKCFSTLQSSLDKAYPKSQSNACVCFLTYHGFLGSPDSPLPITWQRSFQEIPPSALRNVCDYFRPCCGLTWRTMKKRKQHVPTYSLLCVHGRRSKISLGKLYMQVQQASVICTKGLPPVPQPCWVRRVFPDN